MPSMYIGLEFLMNGKNPIFIASPCPELLPPVPPRDVKAVTMLESVRVTWQSSSEPDTRKSPLLGYHIVYGPADDPSEINRVDLGANAVQFAIRGLSKFPTSCRLRNHFIFHHFD